VGGREAVVRGRGRWCDGRVTVVGGGRQVQRIQVESCLEVMRRLVEGMV
jgi:hypothetical protein